MGGGVRDRPTGTPPAHARWADGQACRQAGGRVGRRAGRQAHKSACTRIRRRPQMTVVGRGGRCGRSVQTVAGSSMAMDSAGATTPAESGVVDSVVLLLQLLQSVRRTFTDLGVSDISEVIVHSLNVTFNAFHIDANEHWLQLKRCIQLSLGLPFGDLQMGTSGLLIPGAHDVFTYSRQAVAAVKTKRQRGGKGGGGSGGGRGNGCEGGRGGGSGGKGGNGKDKGGEQGEGEP